mgnify:CR=1 FL=1
MATFHSLEELQNEAIRFAQTLSPKTDTATLVTLSGELGAGKTSFTQGVAKALGVEGSVTSPTFVIEKLYPLEKGAGRGFNQLVHIDAYRFKNKEELHVLGFDELLKNPPTLIFIEWPENIEGAFTKEHVHVSIVVREDSAREITYTPHG